jgi:hypothetical protein
MNGTACPRLTIDFGPSAENSHSAPGNAAKTSPRLSVDTTGVSEPSDDSDDLQNPLSLLGERPGGSRRLWQGLLTATCLAGGTRYDRTTLPGGFVSTSPRRAGALAVSMEVPRPRMVFRSAAIVRPWPAVLPQPPRTQAARSGIRPDPSSPITRHRQVIDEVENKVLWTRIRTPAGSGNGAADGIGPADPERVQLRMGWSGQQDRQTARDGAEGRAPEGRIPPALARDSLTRKPDARVISPSSL